MPNTSIHQKTSNVDDFDILQLVLKLTDQQKHDALRALEIAIESSDASIPFDEKLFQAHEAITGVRLDRPCEGVRK